MKRRKLLEAGFTALAGGWLFPHRLAAGTVGKEGIPLLHVGGHNYETPTRYFDRPITPTPVFFRASFLGVPPYRPDIKLRVDGLVERPLTFTVADLKRNFEEVSILCVNQCAGFGRSLYRPKTQGTPWGRGCVGQALWTGVRLADVLKKAGVKRSAAYLQTQGDDLSLADAKPPFVRFLPVERALQPDVLLAYGMNGETLPLVHGGPLRLVVPGWVGSFWIKWLTHIRLQEQEPDAFFVREAFRVPKEPVKPGTSVPPELTVPVTTFPVNSVIARPQDGDRIPVGVQEVVGVAYSGKAPIAKVEVSLDNGKVWEEAALEGEGGVGRWQIFRYRFEAKQPGTYQVIVCATDKKGNRQPKEPPWNPKGYNWNGWHTVVWEVVG